MKQALMILICLHIVEKSLTSSLGCWSKDTTSALTGLQVFLRGNTNNGEKTHFHHHQSFLCKLAGKRFFPCDSITASIIQFRKVGTTTWTAKTVNFPKGQKLINFCETTITDFNMLTKCLSIFNLFTSDTLVNYFDYAYTTSVLTE